MVVTAAAVLMPVVLNHTVDSQIDAENEEQHGANMPEPLLEGLHAAGKFADTDGAVTDEPCDEHDGQSGPEPEDNGHDPVP